MFTAPTGGGMERRRTFLLVAKRRRPSTMPAYRRLSRRSFLLVTAGTVLAEGARRAPAREPAPAPLDPATGLPLIDHHVHLDELGLVGVSDLARQRGIKVGVVEHAGKRGHPYPVVLSSDTDLQRWLDQLAGADVYRGIQAEGLDWAACFSRAKLAELDFVLTDAMTFVERDGRLVHLWKKAEVQIPDAEDFMERYVAHHEATMAAGPVNILAAPTYLPDVLQPRRDELWTTARMQRVIAAAVKHRVALEITASRQLPTLPFLRLARAAGAKFTFGTNGRTAATIGQLDYSLAMARELRLTAADLFIPRSVAL